jgi:peroxiredoxin
MTAPTFALPDADGHTVTTDDLRGRATLLAFLRHLA